MINFVGFKLKRICQRADSVRPPVQVAPLCFISAVVSELHLYFSLHAGNYQRW